MYFEEKDLKKFYVLEGIENGVTVTDGLLAYDVEISNDDIKDILKEKFDITPTNIEDLLKHYELHEDEIVREHIKNSDFWDFKNYVNDFYDDMNDFDFIDYGAWFESYNCYYVCVDVDDDDHMIFSLKADTDGIDSIEIPDDASTFEDMIDDLKNEIEDLQYLQDDLTIKANDYRERLIGCLNGNLKDYDLKEIPVKKYKDENEVVNTIKKLNSDKPEDVEQFLEDYSTKNGHVLSDGLGKVEVDLFRDEEGNYSTCESSDTLESDFIDSVHVNVQDILTTDDILYQPSLEFCKEIQEKFYYQDRKLRRAWNR